MCAHTHTLHLGLFAFHANNSMTQQSTQMARLVKYFRLNCIQSRANKSCKAAKTIARLLAAKRVERV